MDRVKWVLLGIGALLPALLFAAHPPLTLFEQNETQLPLAGHLAAARDHLRRHGGGLVSKVEVNFLSGEAPAARPYRATRAHATEKDRFGATRRARWFGR